MNLYESVVKLFYQLANAFFWPVAIALLLLFAYSLLDLGRLLYAAVKRQRAPRTDLMALAQTLAHRLERNAASRNLLEGIALSPALQRFWTRVEERLQVLASSADLDLWLDETLRREELERTTELDRSRAFVRIGPMLGLAGTIIPLGPALQSLLGGDMAGMVNHLVVGFGAVVCGLVLSGVAYYVTLVRERWARVELKEMEDLCELLMRNLQKQNGNHPAEVNGHKEAQYASLR
ncbi:MAG: MotA/TolQ/ExbB proton channel family protein [Blastocatellia bacterium]|nr:MotA/TolQ/ExbB proton channel family protein [Blastocatellia bacterium]